MISAALALVVGGGGLVAIGLAIEAPERKSQAGP